MIQAIIFDCFGVLTKDLWKEFVSTLPEEQVSEARNLNHIYDAGHMDEKDFLTSIKKLTGKDLGTVEALLPNQVNKNDELLTYIKKLSKKYKIGILSNISSNWVRDEFLTKDEQALFDDMVFSFETGLTKPDPEIFKLAAERLSTAAERIVFIDDIQSYCESAQTTGMKAITYQNFVQLKHDLEKILQNG